MNAICLGLEPFSSDSIEQPDVNVRTNLPGANRVATLMAAMGSSNIDRNKALNFNNRINMPLRAA